MTVVVQANIEEERKQVVVDEQQSSSGFPTPTTAASPLNNPQVKAEPGVAAAEEQQQSLLEFSATPPAITPGKRRIVHNPYATPVKKRQAATPTSSSSTSTPSKDNEKIPNGIGDHRIQFFAALLRSSVRDYVFCGDDDGLEVWHILCHRLELPVQPPPTSLSSSSTVGKDATTPTTAAENPVQLHFQWRAALLLEEARHILSTTLTQRWNTKITKQQPKAHRNHVSPQASCITSMASLVPSTATADVVVSSNSNSRIPCFGATVIREERRRNHGVCQLTLQVPLEGKSKAERVRMAKCRSEILVSGAILECQMSCASNPLDHVYLATPCAGSTGPTKDNNDLDDEEEDNSNAKNDQFSLMMFQKDVPLQSLEGSRWTIRLVDRFIPLQRQFLAAMGDCKTLPLLIPLLGRETTSTPSTPTTPTTTAMSRQPQETVTTTTAAAIITPTMTPTDDDKSSSSVTDDTSSIAVVRLNTSQRAAMLEFLHAPPKSISIVQG